MSNWLDRLLRVDERALKRIERIANVVLSYEDEMKALSDEELKAKTPYFKERWAKVEALDDILPEDIATSTDAGHWTEIHVGHPDGKTRILLEHALTCIDLLVKATTQDAAHDDLHHTHEQSCQGDEQQETNGGTAVADVLHSDARSDAQGTSPHVEA